VSMVEGDKDVLQQGQTTILLEEAVDTVIIESQVIGTGINVRTRVADPHHPIADPDPEPAFHFNADPDQAFSLNADPDPDPAPH
jgi:hypothetical protein